MRVGSKLTACALLCTSSWALANPAANGTQDRTSAGLPAPAACTALLGDAGAMKPRQDFSREVQRIRRWVKACSRMPTAQEQELFTWGYREKIQRALGTDRLLFDAYETSRQRSFSQLVFRAALNQQESQRTQQLEQARNFKYDRRLHNLLTLGSAYTTTREDPTRREALYAAQIEMWLPGFLDQAEWTLDALQQRWVQQHKSAASGGIALAQAQGQLTALGQWSPDSAGTAVSYGWGLYFGDNPIDFVEHLASEQHAGMVCRLPVKSKRWILELSNAEVLNAMRQAGIVLPAERRGIVIGPKTEFVRPAAFERAARGHLVRAWNRYPIYVDKALLDFPQACQLITLENFPCAHWEARLSKPADLSKLESYLKKQALPAVYGDDPPSWETRLARKNEGCRVRNAAIQTTPS